MLQILNFAARKIMQANYDIIVVGAGHAGCEAAAAAANLGSKVLLITMNMQTIAQMSCNPAMGGIAKGQIVREIDALGGYSGIVSDRSMIQFRMLNRSKGPAMWSPRTQNDRMLFAEEWRLMLERTPNVDFWQDMVRELIVERNKVVGVRTSMGIKLFRTGRMATRKRRNFTGSTKSILCDDASLVLDSGNYNCNCGRCCRQPGPHQRFVHFN